MGVRSARERYVAGYRLHPAQEAPQTILRNAKCKTEGAAGHVALAEEVLEVGGGHADVSSWARIQSARARLCAALLIVTAQ